MQDYTHFAELALCTNYLVGSFMLEIRQLTSLTRTSPTQPYRYSFRPVVDRPVFAQGYYTYLPAGYVPVRTATPIGVMVVCWWQL
jgi:hypothetical protein